MKGRGEGEKGGGGRKEAEEGWRKEGRKEEKRKERRTKEEQIRALCGDAY